MSGQSRLTKYRNTRALPAVYLAKDAVKPETNKTVERKDGQRFMAYKYVFRQLISKWSVMYIDMVNALDSDLAVINEDRSKEYIESEEDVVDT